MDAAGEIEASADLLLSAGKYLWDQGVRERPVTVFSSRSGEEHTVFCSTCGDRVTGVTARVGKVDFSPRNVPIRFEKPLINDPVSLPGIPPFRLTALRFNLPYGVVFLDTAGDCEILKLGREISGMSLFPDGAELLFVYVREEREMHLRAFHRDGSRGLWGDDLCAALAAAVACGRCLPDTAVTIPLSDGDARAVCTKEWDIFLTMPILS
jgi:diaminopimelate epimerase